VVLVLVLVLVRVPMLPMLPMVREVARHVEVGLPTVRVCVELVL
jgi:hypothetical protein